MKIKCDRQVLIDNISIVQKAVSNKSTLPILECIYLSADETGLKMIANDLNLGIEAFDIEHECLEEGSIALPARLFSDISRKLPDGLVTINSDSRNVTVISAEKAEFKILGLPGEEFPFPAKIETNELCSISCADFRALVRQTIFAVSDDESKPIMTGELLSFEDKTALLAALDGFRIAVSSCETETAGTYKAIVPSKTLAEVVKILPAESDKMLDITFSQKHAMFACDNFKVVTRLIDGEFINYENIFKTESTTFMRINKTAFLSALERAMLINTGEKKSPVKLCMTKQQLVISSFADTGTVYEEISIELEGGPLDIGFNPKFLIDVLKVIDEQEICMGFTTPLSQSVITVDGSKKYKFLVLPLRLKS